MSLEIHGLKDAEDFLKTLGVTSRTVLSDTLNILARSGREKSVKAITSELNLAKPFVDSKFELITSNYKTLVAKIRTKSKGLLLSHFEPLQLTTQGRRSGVSVKVKSARKKIPKAFMLKGKGNRNLIAIRKGKGKNNFSVLYGPSPSQAFSTFHRDLEKDIHGEFFSVFEQELGVKL